MGQFRPGQARPGASERNFDFGTILASGQSLEHRFTLVNTGSRPLRLLTAEALTPCCSSIDPVPESIPAGGSAKVAVKLRPGYQSGPKRVQFVVLTDRDDDPAISLWLSATLTSALDVEFDDTAAAATLAVGKAGTLKGRVIGRRTGKDGFSAPSSLSINAPAKARFVGVEIGRLLDNGFHETVREIEIDLPASREPGTKSAELRLAWDKPSRDDRRAIVWSVTPALRATPPALVLDRNSTGSASREVVIRSTGTAFHVLGVEGKAIRRGLRLPSEAATLHRLDLPLDRDATGISDLRILTDHPDQPIAKLTVLIQSTNTPDEDGGTPR